MTAPDEDVDPTPDWQNMIYEVFNPDHTVGAACNRNGEIVGLHIGDEARDNDDRWMAAEILRVAGLAHQKSRVGLRNEMAYNGTLPYILESFGLPSENQYIAMENEEFGETLMTWLDMDAPPEVIAALGGFAGTIVTAAAAATSTAGECVPPAAGTPGPWSPLDSVSANACTSMTSMITTAAQNSVTNVDGTQVDGVSGATALGLVDEQGAQSITDA